MFDYCFSCNHNFKVVNGGPFPAIFVLDFMERTKLNWICPLGSTVLLCTQRERICFSARFTRELCVVSAESVWVGG